MASCKDCITACPCFRADPQGNQIKGVEKICKDFKPRKVSSRSKNPNNSKECEKQMCKEACENEDMPNYQEEYYRLTSEVGFLRKENLELKETILGMCKKMFRESENNA